MDGKKLNVASVPRAPGRPAGPATRGLGRVLDHWDAERLDVRHRGDVAEQVDDDDCLCPGRQGRPHRLLRHAEGLGVDVAEDGPRARRRNRLDAGIEGERRDDDLVAGADAERAQRDGERVSAVGHADCVAGAAVGGELLLEGADLGAEDEHPGVHDASDGSVDLGAQRVS